MKYSNLRFFLAALLISLLIMHKAQGQMPAKDTLTPEQKQQKELAELDTLIKKKFYLSFGMIDSVYNRLQNTLTVTDYNRNIQAFNFFVDMMIQTWLEDYRRKKPK